LKDRLHHTEAVASSEVELLTDDVSERLSRLGQDTDVDRLKTRRGLPAWCDHVFHAQGFYCPGKSLREQRFRV
jgi:hypothetical protein